MPARAATAAATSIGGVEKYLIDVGSIMCAPGTPASVTMGDI
jgi:hypothetical protein